MAKKKKGDGGGNNNAGNTASNDGGEKNKGDGGEKKEETPITVILKIDMHCEGCATKIVKCVKGFAGVETVKSESQANKLTVVGKVDPITLRDKLAAKTNKKVDLVSPQPKKDNKDDGGDTKKKPPEKSNDDKKTKEPPVTTAVLKLNLHCQGCIQKIHRIVTKTKVKRRRFCDFGLVFNVGDVAGFTEMSIDKEKELLTVKGSMDMKVLAESLKEKLKTSVDIVPPKKEKEKGENNGGGGGVLHGQGHTPFLSLPLPLYAFGFCVSINGLVFVFGLMQKKKGDGGGNNNAGKPPVTTAVLKLNLHCQGCIQKIHRIVTKTKGFTEMSIDKEKELLTVKGSMDMKVLAESLKEKLKTSVDIVPPKKEKEKGENNGGGGGGGGDKKKKEVEEGKEGGKLEGNRMDFPPGPTGYGQQIPYVMPYGPGYGAPGYPIPPPPMYIGNPPEMFSDENPNACSIM
ncbi:hypothetical protein C1H46_007126 [Malus baccata]|uniref:HMA domain-containing protein n=1 Tax=Malus baccata TaxID=106549 RepID=A0A540N8C2_MALBA|nr:hypothetical protein C1H46_007126 [Malus baccata]